MRNYQAGNNDYRKFKTKIIDVLEYKRITIHLFLYKLMRTGKAEDQLRNIIYYGRETFYIL